MLVSNGMFEEQAEQVMELAIPELNSVIDNYNITFNSPSNEYPDVVHNVIFLAIKPIALKWIDENKPHAWFRDMFI